VAADLDRLNTVLRPAADYAAQGVLLPRLMTELHTLYVTDPEHRVDVCQALMDCYQMAGVLLKNLGVRGLPSLAAFRAQQVAEELDDPAWLGLAAWLRAFTVDGNSRPRMLAISLRGANELECHLDDPRAAQMYGALHLHAALASAAMRRGATALITLTRPRRWLSGSAAAGVVSVACASDRTTWGSGGCPSPSSWVRPVAPGRSLGSSTRHECPRQRARRCSGPTWDVGWRRNERPVMRPVGALLRAETIADLLRRAPRDAAAGRDLRGMAYRMGIGVG
jgi:hypothetical protein